jgi:DNA-directed RNA polymerase specialized sigma24 family protein
LATPGTKLKTTLAAMPGSLEGIVIDLEVFFIRSIRFLFQRRHALVAHDSVRTEPERSVHARARPSDQFPPTAWTRIEKVKDATPSQARHALAELCDAYWRPVYAFIRRKGNDPHRAADLTQGFFALLLEPGALATVAEDKGRFRSFLMAACTHFMNNQRVYERALKRGGRQSPVSIDQFKGEEWLRLEPFHELTPDRIFLREWATTLLQRVMTTLQAEAHWKGNARLFERIRPVLLGREASPAYAVIAADLGVSESRIKLAVHRYRGRYRLLLREEIARTLDDPAEIEEEITTLIAALTV